MNGSTRHHTHLPYFLQQYFANHPTLFHPFAILSDMFTTTRDNWLTIRSLALNWGFAQVIVRSLHELKHLDRQRLPSQLRQSFNPASPYLVNRVQLQQRGNQHVQAAMPVDVEEN